MANNDLSITPDQLPSVNGAAKTDILILTIDPSANANVVQITLDKMFSNTTDLTVKANTLIVSLGSTPANSTTNVTSRSVWFDNSYVYFALSNNVIKRIALESF